LGAGEAARALRGFFGRPATTIAVEVSLRLRTFFFTPGARSLMTAIPQPLETDEQN
jgi:hypothetical protein